MVIAPALILEEGASHQASLETWNRSRQKEGSFVFYLRAVQPLPKRGSPAPLCPDRGKYCLCGSAWPSRLARGGPPSSRGGLGKRHVPHPVRPSPGPFGRSGAAASGVPHLPHGPAGGSL